MTRAELYAQNDGVRAVNTSWHAANLGGRSQPSATSSAPGFRWSSLFDELDGAVIGQPERRVFRGRGHVATVAPVAPEPTRSWRAMDWAPLTAFGLGCLALVGLSSALLPSATAHWADGEIMTRPPMQRAFAAPMLAGLPQLSRLEAFAPVHQSAVALLQAPEPEKPLDRTTATLVMAALSPTDAVSPTANDPVADQPPLASIEFVPAARIAPPPVTASEAAPPRRSRKPVAEPSRPAMTTVAMAAEKPRAGGAAGTTSSTPDNKARSTKVSAPERVADAHRPAKPSSPQAPAAANAPPAQAQDPSPTIFSVLFPLLKAQPDQPSAFGFR